MDPQIIAAWQAFFGMAAGSAAGLTGLLFVALSLHLREINADPFHHHRARASLAGLVLVLALSGLVLLPHQTGTALGIEQLVALAAYIGLYSASLAQIRAVAPKTGIPADFLLRNGAAVLLLVSAIIGSVLLLAGREIGLDVLAFFCLCAVALIVFNSWGMLVGIASE